MYHPINGGTKITLRYEGNYEVWLPPKPSDSAIVGCHLKKSQQVFTRTELPEWFEDRYGEEQYQRSLKQEQWEQGEIKYHDLFTDPMVEEFRRKEWEKRLNGLWLFINGIPTYITGTHYFYLNWTNWDHSDNDGYPIFYKNQVHRFYFRKLCEEDPNSLGYILLGPRGFGKSTEELANMLDRITRGPRNSRSFLQSKTDDDAKDVLFISKLVPAFNKLPEFFKPTYNHSTSPTTELSFKRQRKSGAGAKRTKYKPEFELNNSLAWKGAGEKVLDGESALDILEDEIGKSKPHIVRVDKRVKVNRFVVFRNNRKRGIQRCVSTVEELTSGGKECKIVWDTSDPDKRTKNGQTNSSLYRIRESILDTDTQFADEFGVIDKNRIHPTYGVTISEYHFNEREAREHDPDDFADWIRKNPIFETDMWTKPPGSTAFNTQRLQAYKNELLKQTSPLYIKGNFNWTGKPFESAVEFERNDHAGRWCIAVLLDDEDSQKTYGKANNWTVDHDYGLNKKVIVPLNRKRMHFGGDPIKDIKTKDPRASKMSVHLKLHYIDNLDRGKDHKDWLSDRYIGYYNHRPEDPQDAYEDIAMAMFYYGTWGNIETNVSNFHTWLRQKNMDKFIMTALDFEEGRNFESKVNNEEGMQSTTAVQQAYINALRTAFKTNLPHRINYIPFIGTIDQCIDFDPKNITVSDDVVSLGFAALGDEAVVEDEFDVSDETEASNWFSVYDISGNESVETELYDQSYLPEDY